MGSRWHFGVALVILSVGLIGLGNLSAQDPGGADETSFVELPAHVPGEILVKFRNGVNHDAVTGVGRAAVKFAEHHKTARGKEFFDNLVLVKLHDDLDVAGALKALKHNPHVEYVEPNYLVRADNTPNDAYFGNLWGSHNTGQTGGTPDADMDLPEAWDMTTGSSSIVVAVIDTGVDYNHPDLAANIWTNPGEVAGNGLDDDGNGFIDDTRGWDWVSNDNNPMDDNSHGTHVAGTIAAVGNNGIGVAGVSWSAKIMPLKFLNSSGSGSASNAILAIQYATNKGAHVMSNSYGTGVFSQSFQDAITAANNAGAIFVASAGNDNTNAPQYPAYYSGVITVASTDHNDVKSSFSNYGTWVDIAAPGSSIYSTIPNNSYGSKSGTSMATPQISGLFALLLGYGIPRSTAIALAINGADDIDSVNPGYEGSLGTGRANASAALLSYGDSTPPGSVADLSGTGLSGSQIRLNGTAPTDNIKVAGYRVERSVDGVNYTEVSGTYRKFPITIGGLEPQTTYYLRVRAYDIRENLGDYSNVVATATAANGVPNTPPAPTGKVDPVVAWYWTYFAQSTDPDGNQIKYTFDWGDGTTNTTGFVDSGTQTTYSHIWYVTGSYNIRVKTEDVYGAISAWSDPHVVTVVPNSPPTVPGTLTGPAGLIVNEYGSFTTGGATEPNGSSMTYTFDWGDGSTSTSGYLSAGSSYTISHRWTTAGSYSVRSKATDPQGASSAWTSPLPVSIQAANVPPNTPAIPSGLTTIGINVAYTYATSGTDDNGHNVQYTFDWGDGTTATSSFVASGATGSASHTWTSTGVYSVLAKATDTQGAISGWSEALVVTVGTNNPPVTPSDIRAFPMGTTTVAALGSVQFDVWVTDPDGNQLKARFDWGDGTTTDSNIVNNFTRPLAEKTWLTAGVYSVRAKGIDINGAESDWSLPKTITVLDDLQPPAPFTIVAEALSSSLISASFTQPSDDVGLESLELHQSTNGVSFVMTSSMYASATGGPMALSATGLQPNTTYYHKVICYDFTGKTSTSNVTMTTTMIVGNPPLTPSIPSGTTSGSTSTSYTYSTSSTDPEADQIRYTFDWGDGQTTTTGLYASGATGSSSHSWSAAGTYLVKVQAKDSKNNLSGWSTALTVTINTPPGTPSTPSGTTSGNPGTSYTYTTSATDPDGNQVKYTFDWGDTTTITTGFYASGATGSASHSWSSAGTYLVKVKAIDSNNAESAWSTTLSVTINPPNSPPTTPSTPSGPTSGAPGTSYTYTTSSTDPNGNTIKYTFDWGDTTTTTTGFYASGATGSSSHSWSSAGTYLVKVKAIDSNNAESAWSTTLSVTIAAAQPDLITNSVTFTATSVRRGRTFSVTSAVNNQGTATAGASTIAFRLSANTVWGDADDIIVTATRSVGSLAAGATSSGNTTITVPSSTPLGYYYVLGYADSQGVVIESVETNNSKSSTNRIQVKS